MESYIYFTTLTIVLGFCSPDDTYHIKALSNATCGSIQSCITLSEFAQRNSTPAKNTTVMFLPGKHTLSSNISVADTNSYSLLGVLQNATTRIKCEKNIGFTFSNILYIRIHHLVFTSCGIHRIVGIDDVIYDPPRAITQMFGLVMDSILQIDITNSTFENNTGTALGVNNSRLTLDGDNSFFGNCRSCSNISSCSCRGGGLYSSNCELMFIRYASFQHNIATYGGGIYMRSGTLDAIGTISFQRNIAQYHGGGMYADDTLLYFEEESSTLFYGNSVGWRGGGALIHNGVMEVHGYIIFNNNTAPDDEGGGIYANLSILHFTNNTVLENNSAFFGGGIQALRSNLIFSGNNLFAKNSAFAGGGIFVDTQQLYC